MEYVRAWALLLRQIDVTFDSECYTNLPKEVVELQPQVVIPLLQLTIVDSCTAGKIPTRTYSGQMDIITRRDVGAKYGANALARNNENTGSSF